MKLKGLLIAVLLLVGATSAFAVDATLTVGQGYYTAGGTVTVPVVLKTNGNSISALALDVKYDTTLLSNPVGTLGVAASTAKKALYTNVLTPVGTEGTFRILMVGGIIESTSYPNGGIMTDKTDTGTSGLLADGVVALVTFNVVGNATGNITLGSYVDASDPNAAQVLINGTAEGIAAGKVGDCNGLDGKITLADLTYAINIVIKKPNYVFNNRCDTNITSGVWNPDGKTTLADITTLINILIKKPNWTLP